MHLSLLLLDDGLGAAHRNVPLMQVLLLTCHKPKTVYALSELIFLRKAEIQFSLEHFDVDIDYKLFGEYLYLFYKMQYLYVYSWIKLL